MNYRPSSHPTILEKKEEKRSSYIIEEMQEVLNNQSCHATIKDSNFQHAHYEINMESGNWYLTKVVIDKITELDMFIGDVYAKSDSTRVFLHNIG